MTDLPNAIDHLSQPVGRAEEREEVIAPTVVEGLAAPAARARTSRRLFT
jgi:hypothetical protein